MNNHNLIWMSCNVRTPLKKYMRSILNPKLLSLVKAKDIVANAALENQAICIRCPFHFFIRENGVHRSDNQNKKVHM